MVVHNTERASLALSGDQRRRADLTLWAATAGILGGMFVLFIPKGLPYDELSHWQNVQHLQQFWTLPVLGDDVDVSHEAVQAPLSYCYYALVAKMATLIGTGPWGQFHAVRFSALPWLWLSCVLLQRLVSLCLPLASRNQVRCAVAVTLLNPMLLAVGASVQNDIPALCLGLTAILVALSDRPRKHYEAGLCVGLALLSKITIWPAAVVAGLLVLRSRGPRAAALTSLTATATFAWWVLRNITVYGDPTGASAIERIGITFPPLGWDGPSTVAHLARATVTFLWVPVEYYGNNISAGKAVEILVVVGTLCVLTGLREVFRQAEARALTTVLSLSIASTAAWVITDVWFEGASFRTAYLSLTLWSVLCAAACRHRLVAIGLIAISALLIAWSLFAVLTLR